MTKKNTLFGKIAGGFVLIIAAGVVINIIQGVSAPDSKGGKSATTAQAADPGPLFKFSEAEAVARMGKADPELLKAKIETWTDAARADCSRRTSDFASVTICSVNNQVQSIDYKVMGNGNDRNKMLSGIVAHAYMNLLAPPEGYTRRDTKRIEDEVLTTLLEKRDAWVAIDQWFVVVDSQGNWSYSISLSPSHQPWSHSGNSASSQ